MIKLNFFESLSTWLHLSLTLLMFCKTSFILSGWTADRTNMRVTTSTLPSGTFSLRSSLVKSHWKAQQRSEQYRGFCCKTEKAVSFVLLCHYWKEICFIFFLHLKTVM